MKKKVHIFSITSNKFNFMKFSKKLKVYQRRFFKKVSGEKKPELTPTQAKALSVVRALIRLSSSKLLIAPLSGDNYIEFKVNNVYHYYVHFNRNFINIKSSTFSCYVAIDAEVGEKLIQMFNSKVEQKRKEMESEYDMNILKNLEEILNKVQ